MLTFICTERVKATWGVRTLKQYVHNKPRPEGSIAKVYLMNESGTFCLQYLIRIETRFTRDELNDDSILDDKMMGEFEVFIQKVRPLGASSIQTLSQEE